MRGEGPSTVFEKKKIQHMDERLCAIEGGGSYGFANMSELCLVLDVTIPPKFKVPDFDKYNLLIRRRATVLQFYIKRFKELIDRQFSRQLPHSMHQNQL